MTVRIRRLRLVGVSQNYDVSFLLGDGPRALAAGFQMFLSKPIDPARLVDVVATLAGAAAQAASAEEVALGPSTVQFD